MKQRKKRKPLKLIFRRAKVNWPPMRPINIGMEWDTTGINDILGRNMGPAAHRTIEEIRTALVLLGSSKISGMLDPEHIPATAASWSEAMLHIWHRWQQWNKNLKDKKTRDAVILFAKGERLREIETQLNLRNGDAAKKILTGVKAYVLILRGEICGPV